MVGQPQGAAPTFLRSHYGRISYDFLAWLREVHALWGEGDFDHNHI
ncbi:hypothetical protein L6R29_25020 [Myxococcota bacterium]|nr:hypothetical protein [Myxococcota bacterium]